ncbi:helix-turn-helix transcriptional regulator [Streptosporangiaceae bacterium NEAU-GS5]|nr:helix-turn-helix transcriptional regulator [Streptosporangiaceae bacterium NEAU-GS5]
MSTGAGVVAMVKTARSRATRRRIAEAAAELFVRDGYLQTTMAAIAREAGVAVQTLYLAFEGKAAILSAAVDLAVAGDDAPVPILDRPWVARVRADPDGVAALGVFVGAATQIIERFYPLYAAMRAASADPEVADLVTLNKRQRHMVHAQIVRELSEKDGFRPEVGHATDVVYTMVSQETYGLMVAERGRPAAEWSAWVARVLTEELFRTR